MSSREPEQFEDEALKVALKRACGKEPTPPRLRHQVQMAMLGALSVSAPSSDATTPANSESVARSSGRSPGDSILTRPLDGWTVTGIAAALIIVVSGWVYLATRPSGNHYATQWPAVPAAMTDELAQMLVKRHDESFITIDAHNVVAPGSEDFIRIRSELIKKLDQPVWVSDFRGEGWKFKGAAISNIGDVKAAHLLYTKGDANLSMMSMPVASSCGVSVEPIYENTVAGHPIVSFTTGGEMFALVGFSPTGSLTVGNLTALRDKYKNDITASIPGHHEATAMAR